MATASPNQSLESHSIDCLSSTTVSERQGRTSPLSNKQKICSDANIIHKKFEDDSSAEEDENDILHGNRMVTNNDDLLTPYIHSEKNDIADSIVDRIERLGHVIKSHTDLDRWSITKRHIQDINTMKTEITHLVNLFEGVDTNAMKDSIPDEQSKRWHNTICSSISNVTEISASCQYHIWKDEIAGLLSEMKSLLEDFFLIIRTCWEIRK